MGVEEEKENKGRKLEEDGFNVCASAVLAEESRKDECFVLLSLKSRKKKCVQPGHCASVRKCHWRRSVFRAEGPYVRREST